MALDDIRFLSGATVHSDSDHLLCRQTKGKARRLENTRKDVVAVVDIRRRIRRSARYVDLSSQDAGRTLVLLSRQFAGHHYPQRVAVLHRLRIHSVTAF